MSTTNDEPNGLSANGSGPSTGEQPPRTVAEEAALLVDLLSRRSWDAGGGMPSASSHTAAHHGAGHASGPGGSADDPPAGNDDGGASGAGARPGGIPLGTARKTPECTCGGREPAACRLCPVCQLISFVQQVNPDTIERVADFVGFAASALRDLATAQREHSDRPQPPARPEPAPSSDQTQPIRRPPAARDDAQEGPA